MAIVRKIWKLFVRASEIRKESDWQAFLACFTVSANKFYFHWQCTYIVFFTKMSSNRTCSNGFQICPVFPSKFYYNIFLPFSPHKSGTRIAFYIICRVNLIGGVMVKSARLKCGRLLVWAPVESKQTIKLVFLASLLSKQH